MTVAAPVPIWQLAKVVRSKNAGPFQFTIDLLFRHPGDYARVRESGVLTTAAVAAAYRLPIERVQGVYFWDAALAIKITIDRAVSAGAPFDNDCYGAQQHAPLLDFMLPGEERTEGSLLETVALAGIPPIDGYGRGGPET